jgi:hypothetical protein
MNRYLSAFIVFSHLMAVPALAGENHNAGFVVSNPNLFKSSFSAGDVAVEIFADSRVDVQSLVAGVDFSGAASAQMISDRVNEKRMRLYPEEEIILSIAPPQNVRFAESASGDKASLVKAIYWWNNTNCSTCYWYAQYTSTVATMFIDDVKYGAYNLYDQVGNGNWIFRYRTNAGDAATRYNTGSKVLRGFKGSAAGVSSKADVVMYFFN